MITLRPHQNDALNLLANNFKDGDVTHFNMPTGTGIASTWMTFLKVYRPDHKILIIESHPTLVKQCKTVRDAVGLKADVMLFSRQQVVERVPEYNVVVLCNLHDQRRLYVTECCRLNNITILIPEGV